MGLLKTFFMDDFPIKPISDNIIHGPITEELMSHLRKINEQKRKVAIKNLGSRWVLHKDHSPINSLRSK